MFLVTHENEEDMWKGGVISYYYGRIYRKEVAIFGHVGKICGVMCPYPNILGGYVEYVLRYLKKEGGYAENLLQFLLTGRI